MSREQSNRIAYLVACVGAFAERHGLTNQSSYQYLRLYKGTDFLRDYYDIEHTFSIDEAVEDLTVICQRNGGALAWNYIMAQIRRFNLSILLKPFSTMNKDAQFLIECLTEDLIAMLMDTYGVSLDEAADQLYNSRTYSLLENEDSGLYYQSAVYVFDMLQEEL